MRTEYWDANLRIWTPAAYIYALGGLAMMWVAVLIPGAELTAADLVNALLYWRSVMAVLLGAQALPQIFGKSGSPAASTSKSG